MTAEDLTQERVYSPFAGRNYPDQVFFGDTHFHTEVSFDAGLVGTTLDIHDAFRSALKLGLRLGQELGANPYKFGLIGAIGAHTALAASREENYFGKYAHTEPSPDRHNRDVIPADDPALRILTSQESASGLMAVWGRRVR